MRFSVLTRHALALALSVCFLSPSSAATFHPVIVVFGPEDADVLDSHSLADQGRSLLRPADVAGLIPDAARHMLLLVDASAFPLSPEQAPVLDHLFKHGAPVLLRMDTARPEAVASVRTHFGIAASEGDVVLRKGHAGIDVFAAAPGSGVTADHLVDAMARSEPTNELPAMVEPDGPSPETASTPALPMRHFDINVVDAKGEVTGTNAIEVARSKAVSDDFKLVTIISKVTMTPEHSGVIDGTALRLNLWAAYLPSEYRLRHEVSAGTARVSYLDHFPISDEKTDFTQVDTTTRGFTVGGSLGTELGTAGEKQELLAAKVPFNLNFSYQHTSTTSLTTKFFDYAMIAHPEAPGAVSWRGILAPRLEHVLVERIGAHGPLLSEKLMTPMMRSATFQALSAWKVPGSYEGVATIAVSAGVTVDEKTWRWDRSTLRHSRQFISRDVDATRYTVDMSDPYLSAEITVLIRSAVASGQCLRDSYGHVELAVCQSSDRMQMWGLDAASRYVNRGSGQCLTVDPSTTSVVTASCENLTYEKQWQWRADRLHSIIDPVRYRLYVRNGEVRFDAPAGHFPDFPVNPYSSVLDPWTSYPAAPRPGIDSIMGPAGARVLPVPTEYAAFPAVGDDQRWRIEVLREGL